MVVEGKVILMEDIFQISDKFKKRLLVVELPGEYPQPIPIDFVQDKVSLLDAISVGDDVKVSINLRGNEHKGKYYISLQGWKIESNF